MGFLDVFNVAEIVRDVLGDKDTSARTAELIQELDYPHIRDLIPFNYYDKDSELFINNHSIGFIIEAQPLIGANEAFVEGMNRILQNNIPRGHYLQVALLGSEAIQESLEYGLKDFAWKGYKAEDCNHITKNYYLSGTETSLKNKANHPLTLRDYRLFFVYAIPISLSKINDVVMTKIKEARRNLLSSLSTNGMYCEAMGINAVMSFVRELVNFQCGRLRAYSSDYVEDKNIAHQMVNESTSYMIKPSHILINATDEQGVAYKSRAVGFHLDKNPDEHYLWQNGNIIADLRSVERAIVSPFIFTVILNTEEQTKSQSEANRKFMELEKKAKSSFAKIIPSTKREFDEWEKLRSKLLTGNSAITNYFIGMRIFCKDSDDLMARESERVIKAFENQGLRMVRSDYMQLRDWLASMPFAIVDIQDLWTDFRRTGAILRAETFQATNLLPLIGDNKLSRSGIILPSYRNQLAFLDIFDETLPITNSNIFVSGTSGAGKSVLAQLLLWQVLNNNGIASVFDMGDSYKSFCSSVGGAYINGATLKFNPFANISKNTTVENYLTKRAERIRDQLCILASPNGLLDEVHRSLILQAITEQYPKYEADMRIDHVVEYLQKYKKEILDSKGIVNRIDEISQLLKQYTTKGIYGEFFNSSEPTLKPDMKFVVTELGDLGSSKDLLMAVLFTLMVWVEDVMYNTPRDIRKINLIDEGWNLLGYSSPEIAYSIERFYRTVRRHFGSCATVTQSINDKNLSTAAQAAYDNSSFKFTLMQDAKAFEAFRKSEPTLFSEFEYEMIKRFPAARSVGYASALVNVGAYSSYHRLLLDPLTNALLSSTGRDFEYREKRLQEGEDIKDILFEMAERNEPQFMQYLKGQHYA